MSRIGKKSIDLTKEATIAINGNQVMIKGPKGELHQNILPGIKIKLDNQQILVSRTKEDKKTKSFHGLMRMLLANMVEGVTKGFVKILELKGTGYRVSLEADNLKILVGFSHPVIFKPPEGIKFEVEGNNLIKVLGIDKQLVGQTAARIRSIRKPEPYKGKGIRYQKEIVRKKAGKTAKTGSAEGA